MTPSDDDRRFAERLAKAYAPPEMSAARAAAFDRRLEERRAASRGRRWWLPAVGLPVAAALALMVGRGPEGGEPGRAPTVGVDAVSPAAVSPAEPADDFWTVSDGEALPAEYEVLALLLEPADEADDLEEIP